MGVLLFANQQSITSFFSGFCCSNELSNKGGGLWAPRCNLLLSEAREKSDSLCGSVCRVPHDAHYMLALARRAHSVSRRYIGRQSHNLSSVGSDVGTRQSRVKLRQNTCQIFYIIINFLVLLQGGPSGCTKVPSQYSLLRGHPHMTSALRGEGGG